MPQMDPGGLATFNIAHGFTESLVRGMRLSFLNDGDYHHLTQCDTLEDCKLNLSETDYQKAIQNMVNISPSTLERAGVTKLAEELKYLRTQAVAPLSGFLDFICYEYMIENVMLLLKGTMSGRSINSLIAQCHPLGMFSENIMRAIPSFENTKKGYNDLYQCVLIDTPVGKYFDLFLADMGVKAAAAKLANTGGNDGGSYQGGGGGGGENSAGGHVKSILEEVEIEIIKSHLMKYYLEDFHAYCETIGGETERVMCDLLKVRADTQAINITLNSFNTPLNEPSIRESDRARLYPSFGYLYPAGTNLLKKVADEEQLAAALRVFPIYDQLWNKVTSNSSSNNVGSMDKTLDDIFYERDVQALELAMESQMHFGCFYAYLKLKEQEIRNLVYITECVQQNMKGEINKFVPILSAHSDWRKKESRR